MMWTALFCAGLALAFGAMAAGFIENLQTNRDAPRLLYLFMMIAAIALISIGGAVR